MLTYAANMPILARSKTPFLGSCPLSIDRKISLSLISLARYVITGQSDTETDYFSRYGFARIRV